MIPIKQTKNNQIEQATKKMQTKLAE